MARLSEIALAPASAGGRSRAFGRGNGGGAGASIAPSGGDAAGGAGTLRTQSPGPRRLHAWRSRRTAARADPGLRSDALRSPQGLWRAEIAQGIGRAPYRSARALFDGRCATAPRPPSRADARLANAEQLPAGGPTAGLGASLRCRRD